MLGHPDTFGPTAQWETRLDFFDSKAILLVLEAETFYHCHVGLPGVQVSIRPLCQGSFLWTLRLRSAGWLSKHPLRLNRLSRCEALRRPSPPKIVGFERG